MSDVGEHPILDTRVISMHAELSGASNAAR
jgi:hypothetical protein